MQVGDRIVIKDLSKHTIDAEVLHLYMAISGKTLSVISITPLGWAVVPGPGTSQLALYDDMYDLHLDSLPISDEDKEILKKLNP